MEFEDTRASKKRKGGVHQRMKRAAEEMTRESALQALLMTYLAQGLISGAMVHAVAQAAAQDLQGAREGYTFPAFEKLASLQHSRNLIRQVYYGLTNLSSLPMPFTCQIPYKAGIHPGSILLPHELFAAFFENSNFWHKNAQSILPCQQNFKSFGTNLMGILQ